MICFLIAATLVAFYLGFRNQNQKSVCVYIIKGHGAKVNENHFFHRSRIKVMVKEWTGKLIFLHAFKYLVIFSILLRDFSFLDIV